MSPVTEVILVVGVLAVLAVVLFKFISMCLADLDRAIAVRGPSREIWRLLIIVWVPFGGMLYLIYGRVR